MRQDPEAGLLEHYPYMQVCERRYVALVPIVRVFEVTEVPAPQELGAPDPVLDIGCGYEEQPGVGQQAVDLLEEVAWTIQMLNDLDRTHEGSRAGQPRRKVRVQVHLVYRYISQPEGGHVKVDGLGRLDARHAQSCQEGVLDERSHELHAVKRLLSVSAFAIYRPSQWGLHWSNHARAAGVERPSAPQRALTALPSPAAADVWRCGTYSKYDGGQTVAQVCDLWPGTAQSTPCPWIFK